MTAALTPTTMTTMRSTLTINAGRKSGYRCGVGSFRAWLKATSYLSVFSRLQSQLFFEVFHPSKSSYKNEAVEPLVPLSKLTDTDILLREHLG